MKKQFSALLLFCTALLLMSLQSPQDTGGTIYQYSIRDIIGNKVSLERYKGKVLLIVNVASKCIHTKQYADLQAFYEEHLDKGVVVLGIPSNDFSKGEPGTEEEISAFCTQKYAVTFPMFSKTTVRGEGIAPLYEFLTSKEKNGVESGKVKWNFHKFLIDREGKLVKSYSPRTKVDSKRFLRDFKKLLD